MTVTVTVTVFRGLSRDGGASVRGNAVIVVIISVVVVAFFERMLVTTLVSVCSPVMVTAGRSVVVNGTVSSTVTRCAPPRESAVVSFDEEATVQKMAVAVLAVGVVLLGSWAEGVGGVANATDSVTDASAAVGGVRGVAAGADAEVVDGASVSVGKGAAGSGPGVATVMVLEDEVSVGLMEIWSWLESFTWSDDWTTWWRLGRRRKLRRALPKGKGGGGKGVLKSGEVSMAGFWLG